MIVVDLGCATYPGFPDDESTRRLIERFAPDVYFGFDPHPSVVAREWQEGRTRASVERKAAWVSGGRVGYVTKPAVLNELRSHVNAAGGEETVECFDLVSFLGVVAPWASGELVLKLDVEGAEYVLLPYLVERGADALLTRILVEWHGDPLDLPLACPVEEW